YTPATQWGCIVKDGFSITVGQIFYGVAWVKSSSTSTAIQTGDGDGNAAGIQWHTGSNNFEFQSARFTVTADNSANGIRVRSWLTSGWTPIEIKDVYYFNLTAIYGGGNEPTEAQMDTLILKSK
ncbi:MAG: hypothetical protein PHS45_03820, partial [Bacilli bacterium]|nr:hypothetical protein [Bacilli bacterium]